MGWAGGEGVGAGAGAGTAEGAGAGAGAGTDVGAGACDGLGDEDGGKIDGTGATSFIIGDSFHVVRMPSSPSAASCVATP